MGCFSWKCRGCGRPINSDYDHGHEALLLFFYKGELVEWMQGQYDGYGRIYDPRREGTDKSIEWTNDWQAMVDAMYGPDQTSGMVVYHRRCAPASLARVKPGRCEDDRNQGWGRFDRVDHDLSYIQHTVIKHVLTPEMARAAKVEEAKKRVVQATEALTTALTVLSVHEPCALNASMTLAYDSTTKTWKVVQ